MDHMSGAMSFAQKLLAWDEAEGVDSHVAKTAYLISRRRGRYGISGNPDTDWKLAEEIVKRRFAREVSRRLA